MQQSNFEKIAVYSRKSRFTGKGESVENQIEMCRQYIRAQYGETSAESAMIYEDEGFSGGNLERPQFKKMMSDARRKKFTMIVVYRLDRISRNIGDFAKLIEELSELGISFVSIKEQFDTSSPMGRAMMYIASVFSQLERETIAERIRDNMHELAKTGRWLGGTTPTGYESESTSKVTVDGKVKKACKLKIIPEEAELVKLIFDKFIETDSLTKTDTFLLQNGYLSKNGLRFSRFTIKGILTNPVYMIADKDAFYYLRENEADLFSDESEFDGFHGIMAYNRTIQKTGKANRNRPICEWIVSVGAHEGIVPGKQWVEVQERLERNCSKSYRKPRSGTALLSGLVFCGKCGDYMRPKMTTRLGKDGERIYTYLCQTKERSRLQCCDCRNINGNLLDRAVAEEITKLSVNRTELIDRLEEGKKRISAEKDRYGDELSRLKQSAEENEKKIKALVSSLGKATGSVAEEYIVKQIDELYDNGRALNCRIEEMERLAARNSLPDEEMKAICGDLAVFKYSFDQMGIEEKRLVLRELVEKIVWDGEKADIYIYASAK
ncbi:MAG: recombinase family protein [Clostridiales bacterium]|nr:recombinase family protein [Clostridiales bacterium]